MDELKIPKMSQISRRTRMKRWFGGKVLGQDAPTTVWGGTPTATLVTKQLLISSLICVIRVICG